MALPLRVEAQPRPAAYAFFSAREASFIEAAVARLIPADELGAGALEAGVPEYIDRQLAGPWGAGERLYRSGPWRRGEPTQGYQLPYTPAELFRGALREVDAAFAQKAPQEQDEDLKALEKAKPEFFEALLALAVEGFFCDPGYGGNRGMVGWKLVGFPGAYANYYELVDRHGYKFTQAPIPIHPVKK
ncbi:MAG TPA: gluconate 2-dehydrogenase subunit 3 family protein [Burkholderiales bacterium]